MQIAKHTSTLCSIALEFQVQEQGEPQSLFEQPQTAEFKAIFIGF